MNQFSWENKYVGVQLKATKLLLDGKTGSYTPIFEQYQAKAEYFLCAALQKNNGPQMQLTPGWWSL
jgi:endoglucanase